MESVFYDKMFCVLYCEGFFFGLATRWLTCVRDMIQRGATFSLNVRLDFQH